MEAHVYQCPCCGSSLMYDGKSGEMKCQSCDNTFPLDAIRELEEAEKITDLTQFGAAFKGRVEVAAEFTRWVNETFSTITAHPNGAYIDCTVRGVDKATGVAEAAKLFGIKLNACYTVGDQKNDLAMLLPYHGAVIETGNPETIEKVGKSTPSVAAFIQEILK